VESTQQLMRRNRTVFTRQGKKREEREGGGRWGGEEEKKRRSPGPWGKGERTKFVGENENKSFTQKKRKPTTL